MSSCFISFHLKGSAAPCRVCCFFSIFFSLNISVDRPRREPNRRRCCHPRHLGRPVRRLGGGRPPRRTLRWQCDRRGIDQASESSGHAATGFSQPCLSKIDPLNRLSRASEFLCPLTHLKHRSYRRPLVSSDKYRSCTANLPE